MAGGGDTEAGDAGEELRGEGVMAAEGLSVIALALIAVTSSSSEEENIAGFATEHKCMSADVIRKAFQATEDGFLSVVSKEWSMKPQIAAVGSCCLVGVICSGTLYIANAGDSRAVLGRLVKATGQVVAMQLSAEHNACYEEVRQELQSSHPHDPQIVVLKHNVWRVKGLIQISRSIGDVYLKRPEYNRSPLHSKFRLRETFKKPILSSEPAIAVHQIQPSDQFVIFASDGLWEHLSNQEAVDLVQSNPRNGIARKLVKAAMQEAAKKREMRYSDLKKIERGVRRHFHDDITVVVVFLDASAVSRAGWSKSPPVSVRGGGVSVPANSLAPFSAPTMLHAKLSARPSFQPRIHDVVCEQVQTSESWALYSLHMIACIPPYSIFLKLGLDFGRVHLSYADASCFLHLLGKRCTIFQSVTRPADSLACPQTLPNEQRHQQLREENEFGDDDRGGVDAQEGHNVNLQPALHAGPDRRTDCQPPDGDQCGLTCMNKDHRGIHFVPNRSRKVGTRVAVIKVQDIGQGFLPQLSSAITNTKAGWRFVDLCQPDRSIRV
ncbi:putative protein phosphatase 2C 28 [Triticum urartu]|uniref:protein-serine/threonine phosphatase n=1 Tax=Triticum urartu TaxID=4572 RepID=M7ZM24_TRIUA|nr:putative protein phosphatase 2C 28 [Triticum urartu]